MYTRAISSSVVLIIVGATIPAAADFAHDGWVCEHWSRPEAIYACTRQIQSGRLSGDDLAVSYNQRGNSYHLKSDYERAIANFSKAIQLVPDFATAYGNRASSYYDIGEYDRTIADYSEAIRLDPGYTAAYTGRGLAYEKKGKF